MSEGPPTEAHPSTSAYPSTFRGVIALLERLRAPGGCPWDREQTPRTLLPYLLEEAHEAAEAIEAGDDDASVDELGDLLLHLAFQVVIAREEGRFDLDDVAGGLIDKMIRRHPHVFGDAEYAGTGHQAMWERLKREERVDGSEAGEADPPGPAQATRPSALGAIPRGLPALVRAYRIQEKVAAIGFDWESANGARAKVAEELAETDHAVAAADPASAANDDEHVDPVEEEFGDLLFAIVNWGRLLGLHPETTLQRANRKFEKRFRALESLAAERGLDPEALGLRDLDRLWEEAKRAETPG